MSIKIANILNEADLATLRNYLVGGALTGAGAAAAIELTRKLRTEIAPTDDKLVEERRTVTIPGVKVAEEETIEGPTMTGTGLGMVGALGAGTGAYALVRNIVTEMERKRAAKELAQAQEEFAQTLTQHSGGAQQKKLAGDERRAQGWSETAMALPPALLATLMLASGAGVYGLLSEKGGKPGENPSVRDDLKPPKLRIRKDVDGDGTPDVEDTVNYNSKFAAIIDENRHTISRGLALDLCATAPHTDVARLVRSIRSVGDYNKFATLVADKGWFDAFSTQVPDAEDTKVASAGVSDTDILSATMLAFEPVTKMAFAIHAAADTANEDPTSMSSATQFPLDTVGALAKFASEVSIAEVLQQLMPGISQEAPVGQAQQELPTDIMQRAMPEGIQPPTGDAGGDISSGPTASEIKGTSNV
jgi:hypothetical protein